MNREIVFTENAPEPVGPYSQAVLCGGTLYCSGQIAAGHLEEGIAGQTERVCRNLEAVVTAAGLKMTDIVKTTCFIADMDDFEAFNDVYKKHFIHSPARSCVAAKALPKGALVEIEAIASV